MSTAACPRAQWFTATLALGILGCSGPPTVPQHVLTVEQIATGNGQVGVIGTVLPLPLKVKVLIDGQADARTTVNWVTSGGGISPPYGVTDTAGIATGAWTLGFVAGEERATATLLGARGSPVTFTATVLPGPASAIAKTGGDLQRMSPNLPSVSPLAALVTDQYRNPVAGERVTWTIESGPVAFARIDSTSDQSGGSYAMLAPTGHSGAAVVRAALHGTGPSVDFTLTVDSAAGAEVLLVATIPAFVSKRNNSKPAVDTIGVGGLVTWSLVSPFEADLYSVTSVGTPSFAGGDLSAYGPTNITVRFTTAGTYRYKDSYDTSATGTVVVR